MKMMKVLVVAVFLLCSCSALMAQSVMRADLSGAYEVPPIASNASGLFLAFVYSDRIEFILIGQNLGTEVQAAHIHLGFPGVAGPVMIGLYSKAKNGTFTGRLTGTLTAADLSLLADRGVANFDDARNAIIGGRAYVNIHTTLAPGGEIRGQLRPAGE